MARILLSVLTLGVGAATVACGVARWEPELRSPATVPGGPSEDSPYLKAHLRSGGLLVLSSWTTAGLSDPTGLQGSGSLYGPDREHLRTGTFTIAADSVVLLETNRLETVSSLGTAGLTVLAVTSAALSAYCLADPKACFGSCPTFYVGPEEGERLVAEGFSSSFARVLEETDVDDLRWIAEPREEVELVMRNEAPETHAVRGVRLLAVPTPEGAEIVVTGDGDLYAVRDGAAPIRCRAGAIDCLEAVRATDALEWFSEADSVDLARQEVVELEFPPAAGPLALVLEARNTLLTTFLFYQTIAYLGDEAGAWLAEIERGEPAVVDRALGLARELGGIEVLVADADGAFRPIGTYDEAGPIATDHQAFPFRADDRGPLRVRLRMARGNWRIGRVTVARLGSSLEAVSVDAVEAWGPDPDALARLRDPERYLVTQRGDAYTLRFRLPGGDDRLSLFLESRGYYYEWLREEWRGEESPLMAGLVFTDPARALRYLAPPFKARESTMEETFWSSRFRRDDP